MKSHYQDLNNHLPNIFPNLHQFSNQISTATAASDGAKIEVMKRPRGRPPGSKNKTKLPITICDTETAMNPYILEVSGGNDVVEAISQFCRRKSIGLCVLTGSGTVGNVTLRQPSTTTTTHGGSTVTFHGRFEILSMSATFLHQTTSFHVPNVLTISIAGLQGQIIGGAVAGPLLAAGTVYLVAASFNNPVYHRLTTEEEMNGDDSESGGGGGGVSGGRESGGMYKYISSSDLVWANTARQPLPPPYL